MSSHTIRKATIKTTPKLTNVAENMEKLERLCAAGGKVKCCSCCGKQYSSASEKVNTEVPCDPAISLLGRHPELKAESQRQGYMYTPTFIGLFTRAERLKPPKPLD